MLINTFYFFVITVLSLCSFIGFGFILNNLFLIKKTNNQNIFNFFFLGLIFIIPLSFFNYLLIGNFFLINILILIAGLFFFFKNAKLVDFKINLLIVFLFFTGLLISKTHEDFSVYLGAAHPDYTTKSAFFKGAMTELCFWNSNLSDKEVKSVYNNSIPINPKKINHDYKSVESLVGYYDFKTHVQNKIFEDRLLDTCAS